MTMGQTLSNSSSSGAPELTPGVLDVDPVLAIGQEPVDADADLKDLLRWASDLQQEQPMVLGYPEALDFRDQDLAPLLDVLANNVGDPGSRDASGVSAKAHELAVIQFMAATAGTTVDEVYGYVTTGGLEGIERGLELARERLPHAAVYASDQAHYGVRKAARRLGMRVVSVPSRPDGSMDPDELRLRIAVRDYVPLGTRGARRQTPPRRHPDGDLRHYLPRRLRRRGDPASSCSRREVRSTCTWRLPWAE
ncbi:hypothetical protein GCM10014715_66140 [Streptomyces spiralis]|uniref:Uncharacterized protein n=1 Tax=Streptomyces spiralis TaxID=66376 RepID=A0A919AEX2_9ACTN|nr:hypothetical protein [Streptomyces spiralis]GHF00730.1 hypothetical protein GCM10014715_66140 [Streptomyces spiralis]